jgi:KipI family sensor histidine kinase inhibitor
MNYPRILLSGDCALVVEFGNSIQEDVNQKVINFTRILKLQPIAGIIEVVPTYRSVFIQYDPRVILYRDLKGKVGKLLQQPLSQGSHSQRTVVEIPVCYGGDYGPDLKDVAEYASMSTEEVVALHSSKDYIIYMLGFLPGFPYLGGLDDRLHIPRLAKPRVRIPAGSIAIGGAQTGIYPLDSPGGWRIIGRTPLDIYDPKREKPILYQAGDCIRFVPVDEKEFLQIREKGCAHHVRTRAKPQASCAQKV